MPINLISILLKNDRSLAFFSPDKEWSRIRVARGVKKWNKSVLSIQQALPLALATLKRSSCRDAVLPKPFCSPLTFALTSCMREKRDRNELKWGSLDQPRSLQSVKIASRGFEPKAMVAPQPVKGLPTLSLTFWQSFFFGNSVTWSIWQVVSTWAETRVLCHRSLTSQIHSLA